MDQMGEKKLNSFWFTLYSILFLAATLNVIWLE